MRFWKQRGVIVGAIALAMTLLAVLWLFTHRPADDPFDDAAITNPPFTSLTYGIQAFLWWDDVTSGLHLDWVQLLGFSHVKQTFAWQDIEPQRGEWHFERADAILAAAEQRSLKLVVRLSDAPAWVHPSLDSTTASYIDAPADNMEDWATFCGTVASRYPGRIAAYQIWNEPNLSREWGGKPPDAVGYVALLRACTQAIRAADPKAILISAGLAPTGQFDDLAHRDDRYLQAMYDAGFQQYIDVVGVHAPGFTAPNYGPDDAERDGKGRWATFRRVEDLRKIMIQNGDAARQIAILEVGWTTDPRKDKGYEWFAVDEHTQAQNLVAAYQWAAQHWRPWVGLMTTIYIAKPTWTPDDEEYWWAITKPDNTTREAFGALAQMPKYCGTIVVPARTPEESAVAPDHNPCH
jgi:hypothetical protein